MFTELHIAHKATKCVSLNGKFVGKQTELLKGKVESDIFGRMGLNSLSYCHTCGAKLLLDIIWHSVYSTPASCSRLPTFPPIRRKREATIQRTRVALITFDAVQTN